MGSETVLPLGFRQEMFASFLEDAEDAEEGEADTKSSRRRRRRRARRQEKRQAGAGHQKKRQEAKR